MGNCGGRQHVHFSCPLEATVTWYHLLLEEVVRRGVTHQQASDATARYISLLRGSSNTIPEHECRHLQQRPGGLTDDKLLTTFVGSVHKLRPVLFSKRSQRAPGDVGFDLAAMVCRQVDTGKKMVEALPNPLDGEALGQLVLRYEKFLLLSSASPKQVVVPTLILDVVWHAHMQHADSYCKTTLKLCGSVLDHNDDIPDEQLERHRTKTRALWNKRYGNSYDGHRVKSRNKQSGGAQCGSAFCECGEGTEAACANMRDGAACDGGGGGGGGAGGCDGGGGGGGDGAGCGVGGDGGGGCDVGGGYSGGGGGYDGGGGGFSGGGGGFSSCGGGGGGGGGFSSCGGGGGGGGFSGF